MRLYHERLHVPLSWWLAGGLCVIILGTTLAAGLSLVIGGVIYLVMGGLLAIGFLAWGAVTVEVTGSTLRAGRTRLAIDQVSDVSALDDAQSAALRGPNADVAAFMLIRPYLAKSVYVAVTGGPAASWPYLLIGTRRPEELAAAIGRAAGADAAGLRAGQKGACDDDLDDHSAETGGAGPVEAANRRKDGNGWERR
jgi:hypothetical protein